jgi:hypothetical protein
MLHLSSALVLQGTHDQLATFVHGFSLLMPGMHLQRNKNHF